MIKLCGMRRREDISYINEFPPDYMGMILSQGFGRSVTADTAAEITRDLKKGIKKVGVFVNEPAPNIIAAAEKIGLDVIQLHGNEDREYINKLKGLGLPLWKAVRVREESDIYRAEELCCDCLLLDSYVSGVVGGTGVTADRNVIARAKISLPFFLAGGINADNLPAALEISGNIDISGGAETEGVKDREKIKNIMERIRAYESEKHRAFHSPRTY